MGNTYSSAEEATADYPGEESKLRLAQTDSSTNGREDFGTYQTASRISMDPHATVPKPADPDPSEEEDDDRDEWDSPTRKDENELDCPTGA